MFDVGDFLQAGAGLFVAVAGATLVLGLWYLARRGTGETTPAPAISPAGAETAAPSEGAASRWPVS